MYGPYGIYRFFELSSKMDPQTPIDRVPRAGVPRAGVGLRSPGGVWGLLTDRFITECPQSVLGFQIQAQGYLFLVRRLAVSTP